MDFVNILSAALTLVYAIAYHKMVLIPMQYAGEWCILDKLFERNLHSYGTKSYSLCSITDA